MTLFYVNEKLVGEVTPQQALINLDDTIGSALESRALAELQALGRKAILRTFEENRSAYCGLTRETLENFFTSSSVSDDGNGFFDPYDDGEPSGSGF